MNALRVMAAVLLAATMAAQEAPARPPAPASFDAAAAARFVNLALACVHQEYPNKIGHVLNNDADVAPPRQLTPAFYGCYDWHSSVHGHWLLARAARTWPEAPFTARALAALRESLTPEHIAAEVSYLNAAGRQSFERPYGLAWLLQLGQELREWNTPEAQQMARTLHPLEAAASARLQQWLPKLMHPIRIGEHNQTAFSFGLLLDAARQGGDTALAELLLARSRAFYRRDQNCPLAYEPSGEDFLSPCLAEADLMRRVLPPREFARWLGAFLPQIRGTGASAGSRPSRH